MSYKVYFINRVVYSIVFIWSILMISATTVLINNNYTYADALAKNEAILSVKKDLAYRSWVASHGGVYVPITKKTQPNPYLAHIKNRDINTSDGQELTLMNPAYTLSQMMKDYSELYGTKGHITSLILMNPRNKPDAWETKALKQAISNNSAYEIKEYIDGKEYFRYLKPLVTQKSCLKCHAFQGYKVGDIRGGVSVSIPMRAFNDYARSLSVTNFTVISIIYILGLLVIFYGRKKAREIFENKMKNYEQHIFSLVNIIEKRDSYTAGHTQRVAKYGVLIAREMGFSEDKIEEMHRACMLHDIGKISTPDSILLKPGKLTKLEYEIIKEHVVVSYELLNKVDIYKDIAEIIRHHHEQYDGSGYPQGLKGNAIPILSQIMTVSDAFDAMTTNRIYKTRKSVADALIELKELSGKQFNTKIVTATCQALENIVVEQTITQRPKSKIEKERFAYFYKDRVTDIYNRDYLEFVLGYNSVDEFNHKCLYSVELHNFTQYNNKKSWDEGDIVLKNFAMALDSISEESFVFRVYGDDFVVLNKKHCELCEKIKKLQEVLAGTDITFTYKHFNLYESKIKNIKDLEALL